MNSKLTYLLFAISYFVLPNAHAQKHPFAFNIQKTDEVIKIDGITNETTWLSTPKAKDFWMNYPYDSLRAQSKTEVMLTYDDKNLYVAAICYDELEEKRYVAQSLKRDFSFPVNDAFAIFIDSECGKNNGQSFSVSPYGVQRDGIITTGGVNGVSTAWNGLWQSSVHKGDGFWSLEMAIPFKTLRYSKNKDLWFINFARNDLKRNETSTWSPVPRSINVASLVNTGLLQWDNPPPFSKSKITLIPYALTSVSRNVQDNEEQTIGYNAGLDTRVAITPSLNLDVTINPDFSQVEVDEQVLNLDRFEVAFPEQRLFFTENNDMFSGLGNSRVRPVLSRRIGSAGSDPVSILAGVKLSGDVGKHWRVGFLDVQTRKKDGIKNAQNYLVASSSYIHSHKNNGASVFTAFLTNRQAFDGFSIRENDFNFTGGTQFEYRRGSSIRSHSYFNFSTNPEKHKKAIFAYGGKIRYRTPIINIFGGLDVVGSNYITDMGYVPRLHHSDDKGNDIRIGYIQYRSNGEYRFYFPKKNSSSSIDFIAPYFKFNLFTGTDSKYQEHKIRLGGKLQLHNRSVFKIEYKEDDPRLFYNFQLSGLNKAFTPGNYIEHYGEISFESGKKNIFNTAIAVGYGDKFLGKQFSAEAEINYRAGKWGAFSLNAEHKELFNFPTGYGSTALSLIGTKAEFSFSNNLFWTTFLQYNTQDENFNINTRFQWRYQPLSDIYFVLSNNYGTDPLFNQTRDWYAALKINYWLNL